MILSAWRCEALKLSSIVWAVLSARGFHASEGVATEAVDLLLQAAVLLASAARRDRIATAMIVLTCLDVKRNMQSIMDGCYRQPACRVSILECPVSVRERPVSKR